MRLLVTNIRTLYGIEPDPAQLRSRVAGAAMAEMRALDDAYLLCDDGRLSAFGPMAELADVHADKTIDARGKLVLPSWCDSHTHLVFAGSREGEFVDRIRGLSYEEIARRGGGILNSADRLHASSEEELYEAAAVRLRQLIAQGTGAIEIKSGYGLTMDGELKMLRVIRRLKENFPLPVRASFLAAHAYPPPFRDNHEGYLKLIIDEMLPRVAGEGLADYMDVFCEQGFFSVEETERLLEAGWRYGLKPKIHANQLHHSGGVEAGIRMHAISVDHLECVGEREIKALQESDTIPTLLPGAAFFLGMHYQPARAMIDAGLPVCLATDFNPGSCPSGNMPLLLTIACTQLKMTPEEAVNAVTLNGAAAMELDRETGSIAVGKRGDFIITRPMPSLAYIPYDYGNNPVDTMVVGGSVWH